MIARRSEKRLSKRHSGTAKTLSLWCFFELNLPSRELEDAGVIEAPEGGFNTEQMGQFIDTKIAKLTT
jgi:hypothetical protein